MRGERFVFTRGTPVIFGNFSIAPEGKITCTPPLRSRDFFGRDFATNGDGELLCGDATI